TSIFASDEDLRALERVGRDDPAAEARYQRDLERRFGEELADHGRAVSLIMGNEPSAALAVLRRGLVHAKTTGARNMYRAQIKKLAKTHGVMFSTQRERDPISKNILSRDKMLQGIYSDYGGNGALNRFENHDSHGVQVFDHLMDRTGSGKFAFDLP